LRARALALGPNAGARERGAILALLGSVERAELLIRRIDAERKSVNRANILAKARNVATPGKPELTGGAAPMPAE